MDRNVSFCMFVTAFIVLWSLSFTNRYKVQGFEVPTRDRQCKLRGFATACLSCDMSCTELRCGRLRPDGHFMEVVIQPQGGVLKGTKCGEGKICVKKKCIHSDLGVPRYIGDEDYHECKPAQPIAVAYTRAEQCIRRGFDGVCEGYSAVCDVLYCAKKRFNRYYHQQIMPLWGLDIGTECGENKICINQRCVDVVGEMPVALGGDNIHNCMQRKASEGNRVKTRHEQCVEHGFDVACKDENRRPDAQCKVLRCGYKIFGEIYFENIVRTSSASKVYPSTGTKCGELRTCQLRACKATAPEKMPTYIGNDIYHDCYKPNRLDKTIY